MRVWSVRSCVRQCVVFASRALVGVCGAAPAGPVGNKVGVASVWRRQGGGSLVRGVVCGKVRGVHVAQKSARDSSAESHWASHCSWGGVTQRSGSPDNVGVVQIKGGVHLLLGLATVSLFPPACRPLLMPTHRMSSAAHRCTTLHANAMYTHSHPALLSPPTHTQENKASRAAGDAAAMSREDSSERLWRQKVCSVSL